MKYSVEELKELASIVRFADMIKKNEEKEKNALVIVLAIIGILAVIGGIVYAVWRIKERRDEDYDLYDDLDYYYDESDCFDIPDDDEVEVAPAEEETK